MEYFSAITMHLRMHNEFTKLTISSVYHVLRVQQKFNHSNLSSFLCFISIDLDCTVYSILLKYMRLFLIFVQKQKEVSA